MKKYSLLSLILLTCFILIGCDNASQDVGECPYAPGCKLQGENFYLVEHALTFPSQELCREQVKLDSDKYSINLSYQDGLNSNDLYISGGFDQQGDNFKFICQKRFYETGYAYFFTKEGMDDAN